MIVINNCFKDANCATLARNSDQKLKFEISTVYTTRLQRKFAFVKNTQLYYLFSFHIIQDFLLLLKSRRGVIYIKSPIIIKPLACKITYQQVKCCSSADKKFSIMQKIRCKIVSFQFRLQEASQKIYIPKKFFSKMFFLIEHSNVPPSPYPPFYTLLNIFIGQFSPLKSYTSNRHFIQHFHDNIY